MKGIMERVTTQPGYQKAIVMGLSATVLSVGGLLSWLGATAPPQIMAPPVSVQDGEWLYTTTNDLEKSREQVKLFMTNQDPTRGQQGLLWSQIDAEALRMLGMAYINIANPKDKSCFAKTAVECIELFEVNIQKEYAKATLPSDKAKAIIRFMAAEKAIASIINQEALKAGEPQDSLFQTAIEKVRLDRAAARQFTPDGVAAQYLKDKAQAEAERKAREKAEKEFGE